MGFVFVILGVTGDLTKKMLIPSLYNLIYNHNIRDFAVVGVSRENFDVDKLLSRSKEHIKNFDKKIIDELRKRFYYFQADFYEKKKFCGLGDFVRGVEKKHRLGGNRIFYLATLPQHFKVIADNLKKCSIARQGRNWTRVVFEKPFGEDLKSAKKLNRCIKSVFKEEQIYRIDHFLGKELVQNISVIRFTNILFEPLWNNRYIDHVQIILSENFGVEDRGSFYDKYGAIKDVVQNHMMQLLALVGMEAPRKLTEKYIRDEKVKVLKDVKPEAAVLGQYSGYEKIKGIKKKSKTETFAALKLFVNNKRWKGVPFYLITGKEMKDTLTSVYIQFKQAPCLLFKKICNFFPNALVIGIKPDEGFYVNLNAKIPGKTGITSVKMDFCHSCVFGPNTPAAYENLFLDIIEGDQSVFVRTDEIEQQWKIVGNIKKGKVFRYRKGSYPKEAQKMINWHLQVK